MLVVDVHDVEELWNVTVLNFEAARLAWESKVESESEAVFDIRVAVTSLEVLDSRVPDSL